jgi:hypothetical protein
MNQESSFREVPQSLSRRLMAKTKFGSDAFLMMRRQAEPEIAKSIKNDSLVTEEGDAFTATMVWPAPPHGQHHLLRRWLKSRSCIKIKTRPLHRRRPVCDELSAIGVRIL